MFLRRTALVVALAFIGSAVHAQTDVALFPLVGRVAGSTIVIPDNTFQHDYTYFRAEYFSGYNESLDDPLFSHDQIGFDSNWSASNSDSLTVDGDWTTISGSEYAFASLSGPDPLSSYEEGGSYGEAYQRISFYVYNPTTVELSWLFTNSYEYAYILETTSDYSYFQFDGLTGDQEVTLPRGHYFLDAGIQEQYFAYNFPPDSYYLYGSGAETMDFSLKLHNAAFFQVHGVPGPSATLPFLLGWVRRNRGKRRLKRVCRGPSLA